jgi:hypothetical protein
MPPLIHSRRHHHRLVSEGVPVEQSFLLQRVQPALSGLMDGSLSTLAPIFAVVLATHSPLTAFFTGLAPLWARASEWRSPKACPIPVT